MLISRISGAESTYINQNNNISFRSKFFPNEALADAFYIARNNASFVTHEKAFSSRSFARIIEHLLNDGKDDLIKVTRSEKGSTLTINGKRVSFYPEEFYNPRKVDGERVIGNIIYYFTKKNIVDTAKITSDEFKAIKPAINSLNAGLNADAITKNPYILSNLEDNLYKIISDLHKQTVKTLDKLETKIFGK